jgi:outer membrane biosynthesis protein TonB
MPGKARRVASRQAQLNRKKKQQRGPSGIPAVEATTATQDQEAAEDSANQTNGAAGSAQAVATTVAPTATTTGENRAPRPMGAGRLRREQVSSANYVGAELRRILIMGSVVLVVIIILGITV